MKRSYQLVGIAGLAFAAFVVAESMSLRFMTRLGPGPGFFPFLLGLLFGGLSLLVLLQAGRLAATTGDGAETDDAAPDKGWIKVVSLVAMIAAVGLTIETVGYCLTMLAFTVSVLVLMGERRWMVVAGTALVLSFGVYFVFVRYLGVVLPSGVLSI